MWLGWRWLLLQNCARWKGVEGLLQRGHSRIIYICADACTMSPCQQAIEPLEFTALQCKCQDPDNIGEPPVSCGSVQFRGDGNCDDNNNNKGCGWDGGDCCFKTAKKGQVNKLYCKQVGCNGRGLGVAICLIHCKLVWLGLSPNRVKYYVMEFPVQVHWSG